MAALTQCASRVFAARPTAARRSSVQNGSRVVMKASWLPGSDFPAHLENSTLPACYGFDPLGLGADPERLKWNAESERVHCRWAMLGVAGILAQEIVHPEQFWYTSGAEVKLPFNIMGLVAFELFAMHFVEVKRGLDLKDPGSQDVDPLFPGNKLKAHEVGYPGFAIFVPGDLEELKVKEIKNGRLAMLAFAGFTMAAQVTGLNPLAALGQHLADPINTTMFSKAIVVPGTAIVPECAIPASVVYEGVTIPTPCLFQGLWP